MRKGCGNERKKEGRGVGVGGGLRGKSLSQK